MLRHFAGFSSSSRHPLRYPGASFLETGCEIYVELEYQLQSDDEFTAAVDHALEMNRHDRQRMLNLGYYTRVEQQGVSVEDFDARRDPGFRDGLMEIVPVWEAMIEEFNASVLR